MKRKIVLWQAYYKCDIKSKIFLFYIISHIYVFIPELFGFDILIDDTLKPWLLEVNLTPSLGCDSPLDVRLKSALIADLLTLVGIAAVDPILRSQNRAAVNSNKKITNVRVISLYIFLKLFIFFYFPSIYVYLHRIYSHVLKIIHIFFIFHL